MRYTIFTLILTGFIFLQPAIAQESVVESNDYKISYEAQDCHDITNGLHRSYALVSFENKTNEEVIITFDLEKYRNGVCRTCNNEDNGLHHSITLSPLEIVAGTCETSEPYLRVFNKHLDLDNHSTLTDLKFTNIELK
tara:strand:- start:296 stop:709 length:414 start_codon:yes stop_codon:yes gene_type:complete